MASNGNMPSPLTFLQSVAGYNQNQRTSSADQPIRLATIDPAFTNFQNYPDLPPLPKVIFDGETVASGKRYPYVAGYVPSAGQRVWMVPIGTTYLICGPVEATEVQGFYGSATDDYYSTEFGHGSYLEVDAGVSNLVVDEITLAGSSIPKGIVQGNMYSTDRVTGLVGTELSVNMQAGSYTFKAGRSYLIWVKMKVISTVTNDDWIFRLRENNTSGTQRGEFVWKNQSNSYGWTLPPVCFPYQPGGSDATWNPTWTGQRLAGTGTLTINGNTSATGIWIEDTGQASKLVFN
jgi:hypothetical protein